jgi:rSAM/selenodomain-associated transferase 2
MAPAAALDLSVVIPTLNAAARLPATLETIRAAAEVMVADGGSTDGTADVATRFGARVVAAPRGRGSQLAAGVAAATRPWLLLLHADTRLSPSWEHAAFTHMHGNAQSAGYFRFRLDCADPLARRLEHVVALRCRVFALPYGDQGLLVHHDLLREAGDIRPLPLMEDVDLVRRLGRRRLVALDADAITSAERWQRDGWRRRSARNLLCLSLWFAGMPPARIARLYR